MPSHLTFRPSTQTLTRFLSSPDIKNFSKIVLFVSSASIGVITPTGLLFSFCVLTRQPSNCLPIEKLPTLSARPQTAAPPWPSQSRSSGPLTYQCSHIETFINTQCLISMHQLSRIANNERLPHSIEYTDAESATTIRACSNQYTPSQSHDSPSPIFSMPASKNPRIGAAMKPPPTVVFCPNQLDAFSFLSVLTAIGQ